MTKINKKNVNIRHGNEHYYDEEMFKNIIMTKQENVQIQTTEKEKTFFYEIMRKVFKLYK